MSLACLKHLSDRKLHTSTRKARQTEHAATFDVLAHLDEIDRRRSYRSLGYSSIFRYCTEELRYSSSAAGRRIQTARCIRQFPEVGALLRRHEVNLTTVDQVAGILNDRNKDRVIRQIRCKSEREVKTLVESYRPPIKLHDRVRSVRVRVPHVSPQSGSAGACEKSNYSRSGSGAGAGLFAAVHSKGQQAMHRSEAVRSPGAAAEEGSGSTRPQQAALPAHGHDVRIEKRIHIQFLAKPEFMAKYNEAKSILSNRHANASFETVFEAVLDYFIERRSPRRRAERRRRKRVTKSQPTVGTQTKSCPTHTIRSEAATRTNRISRRIPVAIRDRVFTRDGSRCTFVGTTGKRCGESQHLEIDHIRPFALGGTNAISNLRLLCRTHNRLAAEKAFGEPHMARHRARE